MKKETEYIPVQQAERLVSRTGQTIRRLVKKAVVPFKKEKGKLLIEKQALLTHFGKKDREIDALSVMEETNSMLKSQLHIKDCQIHFLQKTLTGLMAMSKDISEDELNKIK